MNNLNFKKTTFLILAFLVTWSLPSFAQSSLHNRATIGLSQGPTTFGVGLTAGTTAGITTFFSPVGKEIYSQFSANFNADGDYSLFLDAAYPVSSLFELSRFWDIYVGLGFFAGDLHRFPIRLGRSDVKLAKDELYFGLRVPMGVMYYIPDTPIQVGVEAAPSVVVSPKVIPHLHAAFVSRVVFKF